MKLTLYDVKWSKPGVPLSPNTVKAHFALAYKNVKYDTIYLSFPDINSTLKPLGFEPHPPGDTWTVPALLVEHDSGEKVTLNDSQVIAEWLDSQEPQNLIFPPGTTEICKQIEGMMASHRQPYAGLLVEKVEKILDPRGQEWYECHQDIPPHDPVKIEERWTEVLAMFLKFADMLDKTPGRFFLGDQPCFADFIVGGNFVTFEAISMGDLERVLDAKPGSQKLREMWAGLKPLLPVPQPTI